MVEWFTHILQQYVRAPSPRTRRMLHMIGVAVASTSFVVIATILVAYDSIFLGVNNIAGLHVGDVAPQDIRAPISLPSYVSDVLTEQRRQEVRDSVAEIYFPPDPSVIRQQSDLAVQILDYIQNIRRDPYGTATQKLADIRSINDLNLDETLIVQLLSMDEKTWSDVRDQITSVLERVMRGEIRDSTVSSVITQLPMQVTVRFTEDQANLVVAIVKDLIRPNTLLDAASTNTAKDASAANVTIRRSFERGQVVVRAGERIDDVAFEALSKLGLMEASNRSFQDIARAGLASVTVLVITGLYISRFKPALFKSSRFMALLAGIFLVMLVGARLIGNGEQFYLYPTAAMALLYVALVGPEIAVIGVIAISALIGLMQNNSFELAMLVCLGGLMASLTLRRPERLNGYFEPGLLVAITNIAVISIFYQNNFSLNPDTRFSQLVLSSFINGILSAGVALAGIYIVTLLFNLPTGLKLVELSQPSQPLLQRLLREAPGTYQHSLQVANLAEQAAHAIGVNADLVRVSALYHDVGKMINPAFFTENQVEGVNPHDALNDPARSAAIIISHITEGEKIARQAHLPARIRDFIMEHHGTQVLYFYQQALEQAGDDEAVDIEQFTYPGPKPQSRETAILMLADSSEAAVRSRKPTKKQDIAETIQQIFDTKMRTGQLDESGLTLNDLKTIRKVFVDMLQAVFHPRISYPGQPRLAKETPAELVNNSLSRPELTTSTHEAIRASIDITERTPVVPMPPELKAPEVADLQSHAKEIPSIKVLVDDSDDAPLADVPPLPRTGDHKAVKLSENGKHPDKRESSEQKETK